MAYFYNITFPTEPSRLDHLLNWLRSYAVPALTAEGSGADRPILSMVDGAAAEQAELDSVCLQLHFASLEDFERWEQGVLMPVMQRYSVDFAPTPLFFATLLRSLPLK